MKSKWLPTMPLHAANWLADPRIQMLSPVNKSVLLESLLRSWMLGKAVVVPAPIKGSYDELWPEYEAVLAEHNRKYEQRVKQTEAARAARHGSVTRSVTEDNPVSVTETVSGSVTEGAPTPTPTDSSTKSHQARSGRRGTRLPDDAVLTDEWRKVATDEGVPSSQVETLFREFVGYWTALPGQKATKLDWLATWRNRCIAKAPSYRKPVTLDRPAWKNSAAPVESRQNVPSYEETRARLAAEDEERRRAELRDQVRRLA